MTSFIIGREHELKEVKKLAASPKSEFLAIYGRRRVGKTFLIREVFNNQFTFHITGLANTGMQQQLANFYIGLRKYGFSVPEAQGKDWLTAFVHLEEMLENAKDKRKIVFIDELPWLDTPKSGFITALEHFWNSWASARKDVFLIVCGSAASWMINKLIRNTGGLYNRVTHRIKLEPFTLSEAELFLKNKKVHYDRYQLVQLYMVIGGIPHYLDRVDGTLSVAQNIDQLCFQPNALLNIEFDQLYRSLFKNAAKHRLLVEILSNKAKGLTREELISESGLPNSGGTTQLLKELEESGFIRKYIPFEKKEKNSLYQLCDFYSLFYLRFIKDNHPSDTNKWMSGLDNPKQRAWAGYAFEQVCLTHIQQIRNALGISGIQTSTSSWVAAGAQIDLVIDRRDRVVNLCEMKFSMDTFTITKSYAEQLKKKITAFRETTGTTKSLFLTMITTFGVKRNEYFLALVQNELKMNDLFEK